MPAAYVVASLLHGGLLLGARKAQLDAARALFDLETDVLDR
jgi:hypothetical protein